MSGEEEETMNLIWNLIYRNEIEKKVFDGGFGGSYYGVEAIVYWVRSTIQSVNPDLPFSNFSDNFSDGLIFLSIIFKHFPSLVPSFYSLSPVCFFIYLRKCILF